MSIYSILKKFDIFGIKPTLFINGEKNFKNPITIFISILFFLSVICFLVGYILDLLSRKNMILETSNYFNTTSSVDINRHPFLIYFTNDRGEIVSNRTFTFQARLSYLYSENEKIYKIETEIPVEQCSLEKHFKNQPERILDLVKKTPYKQSHCIYQDKNLNLLGHYGNIFYPYNYLKLSVYKCVNGSITDGNFTITRNDCAPEEEIESTLKDIFFAWKMINYDVHHKETDPLITYWRGHTFPVSSTIDTDIFSHLNKIIYHSDDDYFVKSENTYEGFQFEDSVPYFSLRNSSRFFIFRLMNSEKDLIYRRTYWKIWDLFAVIGGSYKMLFIIFSILTYFLNLYIKRKYYEYSTGEFYNNKKNWILNEDDHDIERNFKSTLDVKNIFDKLN